MLTLHIEAQTTEEFLQKIQEVFDGLNPPPPKEIIIDKVPEGVGKYTGRNTQSYAEAVYAWIKENALPGKNFSTTSARLILEMKQGSFQYALKTLTQRGAIKMVQKGVWQRIL